MTTGARDLPHAGYIEGDAHYLPLRVYFEDTDGGGVVYHANYLRFFERARWELLGLCGVGIGAALQGGQGSYVVVEATLKYHSPARLGDILVIVSRLGDLRASTCVVHQKVMREGLLLVEGRIRLAFVAPGGKPRRQPAAWIEAFRRNLGAKRAE